MSAFEYCFSTLGCPQLNLHEIADLAQRHGIGSVELRTLSGTIDLTSALTAEFGSPAGLAAFLADRKLKVAALDTSIRLFENFALSDLEPFIPWAEAAAIPYLRIFDGGAQLRDSDLTRAKGGLNDWRMTRQTRGLAVDVMIETHDALADVEQLITFATQIPAARILWDTHHTWVRGADIGAIWHRIAKSVVHLHVKDSRTDSEKRRHYVLPGQGDFPMADLISSLRSEERQLPLSLEWERHWHPELPPLEDALTAARGWWRQGVV